MATYPLLDLTGRGMTPERRSNLSWFRRFALMHTGARSILTLVGVARQIGTSLLIGPEIFEPCYIIISVGLVACGIGGFFPRHAPRATRLAAILLALHIVLTFPVTANHVFLEFVCLGLLALLDETDDAEGSLLMQSLRWVVVTFFFYSGLQKLLYGRYFDGQFLGYVVAVEPGNRFDALFRHFMPAAERERLLSFHPPPQAPIEYGAGPFSVDSPLFLAVSNGVYVFEMAAATLLLFARTRPAAVIASVAFIVAIEAGARELVFGMLMINLLLLFLEGAWTKRLFPLCAAAYGYLVTVAVLRWLYPMLLQEPFPWKLMFDYASE